MGKYFSTFGHARCGFCGNVITVNAKLGFLDQIDGLEDDIFITGDNIPLEDGVHASGYENGQKCNVCGNKNNCFMIVKNSRLAKFETEEQSIEIQNETYYRLEEEIKIDRQKFLSEVKKIGIKK